MSFTINQVTLLGNVGKVRDNGNVIRFCIATSKPKYTKDDGTEVPEKTTWINVACFKGIAEVFRKNCAPTQTQGEFTLGFKKVFIRGELVQDEYEKNGQKMTSYEVIAHDFVFIDKKEGFVTQTQMPQQGYQQMPPQGFQQVPPQMMQQMPPQGFQQGNVQPYQPAPQPYQYQQPVGGYAQPYQAPVQQSDAPF